jgi:L-threonylcarbamoyladenylate synthase
MITQVVKIDRLQPEMDKIRRASEIINRGGLVAFPTETVYGLGGNGLDEDAAKKIYAAKGRPQDNPLILHIEDISRLSDIARDIHPKAQLLMDKFWPGPLTLVFRKTDLVPWSTTGGLETVAVRMPDHPVALGLIREAGVPIAAPSANLSGKPSPTCAEDVYEDMEGRIDMILDGGPCMVGVESTVLDMTEETPLILRPGGLTLEELEAVLGTVELDPGLAAHQRPRSPGQKYKHYAPNAPMTVIEGEEALQVKRIAELTEVLEEQGLNVGIMATAQTRNSYKRGQVVSVGDRTAPLTISSNLFSVLRKFDRMGVDAILAEGIDKQGLGLAVMNRIYKAAGFNIIRVE